MRITEIRFSGKPSEGFVSYVTVVFEGKFAINRLKIVRRKSDPSILMVCMPSTKRFDGTHVEMAHPIGAEFRAYLEKSVLEKYAEERRAHEPREFNHPGR